MAVTNFKHVVCVFNPKCHRLEVSSALGSCFYPGRCVTVLFYVATYYSGSNKDPLSSQFQQILSENVRKEKPFFSVFHWWTSQAVVFVFAE